MKNINSFEVVPQGDNNTLCGECPFLSAPESGMSPVWFCDSFDQGLGASNQPARRCSSCLAEPFFV